MSHPCQPTKAIFLFLLGVLSTAAVQAQSFAAPIQVSNSANGVFGLQAADVNGDGHLDIVTAERIPGAVRWYAGNGDGTFASAANVATSSTDNVRNVFVADLDGDGDQDVAASIFGLNRHVWYANDGSGNFGSANLVTTGSGALDITGADLDLDGDIDLVGCSLFDSRIVVCLNDGSGSFSSTIISLSQIGPRSIHIGELTGDSLPDIMVASRTDQVVAWYPNLGSGTFGPEQVLADGFGEAFSVFSVDLDGDGSEDVLATGGTTNNVLWFKNLGGGVFDAGTNIPVMLDNAVDVVSFDADLDGDPDVLVSAQFDDRIVYLANLGGGVFAPQETITMAANGAIGLSFGDFDEDGFTDLVNAAEYGDAVLYFRNITNDTICREPTGLTALPTASSVTISWTGDTTHLGYLMLGRTLGATPYRSGVTRDTFRTINGLFPGSSYEWRLKARCIDGKESIFTQLMTFTTSNSRNASNAQTASWRLEGSTLVLAGLPLHAQLQFVDVQGRVQRVNQSTTSNSVSWSVSDLPAGMYWATWQTSQDHGVIPITLP